MACAAAPAGTPIRIAVTLSLVVVTAYMPSRNENADTGSMPKVNGSRIAMPVSPDRPGTAPK